MVGLVVVGYIVVVVGVGRVVGHIVVVVGVGHGMAWVEVVVVGRRIAEWVGRCTLRPGVGPVGIVVGTS